MEEAAGSENCGQARVSLESTRFCGRDNGQIAFWYDE